MQLIFSPPTAISTALPCPMEPGDSLPWFERDTSWSRLRNPIWKSKMAPMKHDFETDYLVAGIGTQNYYKAINQFLGLVDLGPPTLGASPGESTTESKWRPQVQSHTSALFGQVLFPSGEARAFTESQPYHNGTGNSGHSFIQCPILGCNYEFALERQLHKHFKVSSRGVNAEKSCADSVILFSNITAVNISWRTQTVCFPRLSQISFSTTSMIRIHNYRAR